MTLLILTGCGKKVNRFTDNEIEEIHAKEAELKSQLVNKTWHYYKEPTQAVQYLEDGSYINYLSPGIRGADHFSGDDGIWDVKYCGSLDADTKYLYEENNKDRAREFYDYNVVVTYVNLEGKTRTYTLKIGFSSGDLILAGDELYDGPAVIEKMPENLSIFKELPGHVWYIDGMNTYALFYDDGYCFMTYGVFMDGSTNGADIYRWGFDESTGILYLMNYYKPDETVYEDVRDYALNVALHSDGSQYIQLVDVWSNGQITYDMDIVDGKDDSARALLNSYNSLHKWTIDNWN